MSHWGARRPKCGWVYSPTNGGRVRATVYFKLGHMTYCHNRSPRTRALKREHCSTEICLWRAISFYVLRVNSRISYRRIDNRDAACLKRKNKMRTSPVDTYGSFGRCQCRTWLSCTRFPDSTHIRARAHTPTPMLPDAWHHFVVVSWR